MMSWIVAKLLFTLLTIVGLAAAGESSLSLAAGKWDVSLRCRPDLFETELFPLRNSTAPRQPPRSWTSRSRRCSLSLLANGTFVLEPYFSNGSTSSVLVMHGRWMVRTNPYCATDRFYDELILRTYPRVHKLVCGDETTVLRRIGFDLHCRLYGHFARNKDSNRGRLSRGLLIREQADDPPMAKRRVLGSFTGRRVQPFAVEDEDDLDF